MKLRPKVKKFAEAMEMKLQQNDYKGSWKECTSEYLWTRVSGELGELANLHLIDAKKQLTYLGEAADVANFLMMLCDIHGHLPIRE